MSHTLYLLRDGESFYTLISTKAVDFGFENTHRTYEDLEDLTYAVSLVLAVDRTAYYEAPGP